MCTYYYTAFALLVWVLMLSVEYWSDYSHAVVRNPL